MLYFIFGFLIGVVIGLSLFVILRPKRFGALRIDQSDPDGPYIFFELWRNFEELKKQKRVIVEVHLKDIISHN